MKKRTASVWGKGDSATLALLRKENLKGAWLNLAAGDGRYNDILLKKADKVIASDKDASALKILYKNTPAALRNKLEIVRFDLKTRFPFEKYYFDGVFCTGTLHLLSGITLLHVVWEMNRVLKPHGRIIFDFATDIKRTLPDGSQYLMPGEPHYTKEQARKTLKLLARKYKLSITESSVPKETITYKGRKYVFSCNFFLVVGKKL